MKLITIDTSTTTCSVALTDDDRLVGEYLLSLERTVAPRLLACVDAVLGEAGLAVTDLDGIGVASGPGSFTGLRIGIATAKGLALAAGKPVAGFSSLAMLAMNIPWGGGRVCPMFDARKREVYAALYDCGDLPAPDIADCVAPPATFLESLDETTIFVGEGALAYRELIVARLGEKARFAPGTLHQPRASLGALLAREAFLRGEGLHPAALVPRYIRPSEAELAKQRKGMA